MVRFWPDQLLELVGVASYNRHMQRVHTVLAVRASCSKVKDDRSIDPSFIVIMAINADVTKPNQPLTGFKRSTKIMERSCQSSWFTKDTSKDALFSHTHFHT